MPRVVHILGNGDMAPLYQKHERKGMTLTCNLPPFSVKSYATAIVDFKFMRSIDKGEIIVPVSGYVGYVQKHTVTSFLISI